MRITLSLILLMAALLFLDGCPPSNPPQTNQTCCGDLAATPFATVDIPRMDIAANTEQVPIELIGCGFYGHQIEKIAISGRLAGCASRLGEAQTIIKFSQLNVIFTTNAGTGCGGFLGPVEHEPVVLENVVYRYQVRLDSSPLCVSWSEVSWGSSYSNDVAYNTLFQVKGPQTLLPILDRYVLGWLASIPTQTGGAVCPPRPVFGGIVSRCPR